MKVRTLGDRWGLAVWFVAGSWVAGWLATAFGRLEPLAR
jgi:hypothetical protein